jgi:uncharacterized membrane protein
MEVSMKVALTQRSEIKTQAKALLKGKVGLSFLALLVYAIMCGIAAAIFGVGLLVLGGALTLGLTIFFLSLSRKEDVKIGDLFKGFNSFGSAFIAYLVQGIFIFLWSLLLIVPGIIAGLRYSMTYYILAENPGIDGLEAVRRSKTMTKGYKGDIFVFYLSFILWFLLAIPTFGLLFIWLGPYLCTASALFYQDLKKARESEAK